MGLMTNVGLHQSYISYAKKLKDNDQAPTECGLIGSSWSACNSARPWTLRRNPSVIPGRNWIMGKGDKRSKRGKLFKGTFGKLSLIHI